MSKKEMENDIRELILLGTKEVDARLSSAYLLEAIARMQFLTLFHKKIGDEIEDSKSTNI